MLGFWYWIEFAQAVFLLAAADGARRAAVGRGPRAASRPREPAASDLRKRLMRHRCYTQIIGIVAIFVTAMWGM